jgi:uncharacterized repeat protein (TIGR02543 family)
LYSWGSNPTPLNGIISLTPTVSTNFLTVKFNQPINLPDPVLEGYVFEGWYMDEELTVPFNLTNMPGNDLLLYAKFTPIASQG